MSLLGKVVKFAGQATCVIGGVGIAAAGEILGAVSDAVSDNKSTGNKIRQGALQAGDYVFAGRNSVGNGLEKAVDTTFAVAGEVGGTLAGGVAQIAGASEQGIANARKIGQVAAGVGLGIMVGDVVQGTLIGVAGGATAGTGVSISGLHGAAASNATLAALGGGSLATGGLGMAGGQALLTGIDVVTAVDGAAAGASAKNKRKNDAQLEMK